MENGIYYVNLNTINKPDSSDYAILIVFKTDTMRTQIYAPMANPTGILIRSGNRNTFSDWKNFLIKDETISSVSLWSPNGYIHFGTIFENFIIQWGIKYIPTANTNTAINLNINMNTGGGQVYPVFITNINTMAMNCAVIDNNRYQSYFDIISSANGYYYWLILGL